MSSVRTPISLVMVATRVGTTSTKVPVQAETVQLGAEPIEAHNQLAKLTETDGDIRGLATDLQDSGKVRDRVMSHEERPASDIGWRIDYQRRIIQEGISLDQGIRNVLAQKHDAKLIMIGETHGHPNQHLDYIRSIKEVRPDVDTLFIEVPEHLNQLFIRFYENHVSLAEVMNVTHQDYKASLHITPELLELTKQLKIRIVGVEKTGFVTTMHTMLNLGLRNAHAEASIRDHFSYEAPIVDYLRREVYYLHDGRFKTKAGIYIGGMGHIHLRNEHYRSISDMLAAEGIALIKFLALRTDDKEWDLSQLGVENYQAPYVGRDLSFQPQGDSPWLLPSLPVIDSEPVHFSEYDLILLRSVSQEGTFSNNLPNTFGNL